MSSGWAIGHVTSSLPPPVRAPAARAERPPPSTQHRRLRLCRCHTDDTLGCCEEWANRGDELVAGADGAALGEGGSSHITLSNSKLKSTADGQVPHNADGLYALNSAYLSIGGVAACPKSQTCNTFDYDTGWGVYLQNTHNVTIDHASANADDTGAYVLDNASNVNLGNSNAEGGGPICITLNGQKTPTGYFTDLQGGLLLINGSHDNAIHDDQFAANTGIGIGSGGNGFFFNPCTNSNQPFSPAESPMGSNNTFTNVCYSSTDIASLEPPQNCK